MGPVAGSAKKGSPCRKAQKNLARRLKDFATVKRNDGRGFIRPGSMQRG